MLGIRPTRRIRESQATLTSVAAAPVVRLAFARCFFALAFAALLCLRIAGGW
jgi:hypothetical protein